MCEVENQESWWCNSVWVQRPENWGQAYWGHKVLSPDLSLKARELGATMSEVRGRWMSQLKQREQICSSSTFLFYPGPQWIGWCPPHIMGEGHLGFSLPIQTLISSWDTLTDNTQKLFMSCLGILEPIKLTITLTHTFSMAITFELIFSSVVIRYIYTQKLPAQT